MDRFDIQSDPQLTDWNAYFQLLQSEKMRVYSGRFVVIFEGKVVADGKVSKDLRARMSEELGVPSERLVIPYVE